MKQRMFYISIAIVVFLLLAQNRGICVDFESALAKGKQAIEAGKYQEATDCMGQLLIDAPNNETKDPRAIAFSSAVMAYGMIHSNSSGMEALIRSYLNNAIKADPSWEYPKKLLKEIDEKK